MDQQRKDIILRLKITHIILETQSIHFHPLPSEHLHNIHPKPVKIHIHIDLQRLISLCRSPVIRENAISHCRYDRSWIIDMFKLPKTVSVVPITDRVKVHIIPAAQTFYFIFCKTGIFFKDKLLRHRIFPEHIQCRMLPVLLHRENPCHIRKRNIRLVFQKIPQKIKVLLLQRFRLLPFPHHTIPLVYQKDKPAVCLYIDPLKNLR